jgi:spermidine synthase
MIKPFVEMVADNYGQQFSVDRVCYESRTDYQHLLIFQNSDFGRVLILDGIVQCTERDEFIYHEMLAHVPIFAHGQAKNVLIIGGGDGGTLREDTGRRHRSHLLKSTASYWIFAVSSCRTIIRGHSRTREPASSSRTAFDLSRRQAKNLR